MISVVSTHRRRGTCVAMTLFTMRFRFSNIPVALLAIVAVASMIKGQRDGGRDPWKAANERLEARCEDWRADHGTATGDPCRPDGPYAKMIPIYKSAQTDITSAKARLASGNIDASAAFLDQALDRASRTDREGTLLGSFIAAKIVDEVLDFIQTERASFGKERIAAILNGRSLRSAKHLLEGERLAGETNLASIPKSLPLPTGPFGRALVAQAMNEHDAKLVNVERAVLARDLEGCKSAASQRGTGLYPVMWPALCEKMINVVNTSARLERARAMSAQRT